MKTTASALEFKQARLENGLTVIAEVNPEAKSAALGYFVKTGSRDETAELAGVSHFLEHMVFKGTEQRDALEVNLEFDRMGASYNAFTGEENTVYYGAVLPEFVPRLLELWSDLMRPALRPSDFEMEKNVILQEIALYQDRPQDMLMDWGRELYCGGHPFGMSPLGTTASITALSQQQMASYHARRYSPSNLVLALAGKLDWDRALDQARELTQHWPKSEAERSYPSFSPRSGEVVKPYEKATQSYLSFFARGVSAQDERRYLASALAHVLGSDGNSRLHWALVDKGLVESVGADHLGADGLGLFIVSAQMDPGNEEEVIEILRREMDRLEAGGVTAGEIERAKNKLATSIVFGGETPMSRLFNLGLGYQYTGRYQPLSEIAQRVNAITPSQVNALLEARPFSQGFLFRLVPGKS